MAIFTTLLNTTSLKEAPSIYDIRQKAGSHSVQTTYMLDIRFSVQTTYMLWSHLFCFALSCLSVLQGLFLSLMQFFQILFVISVTIRNYQIGATDIPHRKYHIFNLKQHNVINEQGS